MRTGRMSSGAFIFAGAHTPYAVLAAFLLLRGLGLSLSLTPAMTAAIIELEPDQVDDATPQLTVLQRVGAAALSVVFSRHIAELHPRTITGAADAFNITWIWALVITGLGVLPAILVARVERSHRQARQLGGAQSSRGPRRALEPNS
jgi:hypothetical protein